MPIQIQEINEKNEVPDCPLCMEALEVDDINFFPCICGYQVCRFCWHRIRTDENGLCPACRTSYPENPAEFRPLSGSDLQKIRQEKRQKEVQRRQKLTDGRRHLSAIRVLQKNLVFVVGLSQRLSDQEILNRQEYFGKYGKILKVVINNNTAYAGSQGPSCSAYVTYSKMEEALRAIQAVNNVHIDGRTLKASLGTTKYCSTYLKNQQCHKADCMYLHELADQESSFTKDDMQAGKHQELEHRLIEQMIQKEFEAEIRAESLAITEPGSSNDNEVSTTQARRHSASSGTSQPTSKQHNSWFSGTNRSGDQGLSARLSSSLNDKTSETKSQNSRKTKKSSQQPSSKQQPPPVSDSAVSTPSQVSSEPSSGTTTPPTFDPAPPDTDSNRKTDTPKLDTVQSETPPTVRLPEVQPETNDHDRHPSTEETVPTDDVAQLSRATDSLFISTTEEQPQPYKPFQRFIHSNENYNSVASNFPLNHFLSPSINDSTWNQESHSNPLPDTLPVQTSNDWEAAFGLGDKYPNATTPQAQPEQTNDVGDDDLGFDPWAECNKGFADLIETENVRNYTQHNSMGAWNNGHVPQQQQQSTMIQNHLPNMFSSSRQDTSFGNNFGLKPPSGFSSAFSSDFNLSLPSNTQAQHFQGNNNFFPSANNSKPPSLQSPTKKGLNEWQNGLRALLPSVNINFAMENPSLNSANSAPTSAFLNNSLPGFGIPPSQNQTTGPGRSLLPMGYDGWATATQAPPQVNQSQSVLFPTNLNRNASLFHNGFGQNNSSTERFSPIAPPPGLNSTQFHSDPAIISSCNKAPFQQNFAMEETPHWMRSLQTLTDTDSSMNSAPSSGFLPTTNQSNVSPFTSWPSLTNNASLPSMGNVSQPPPGFQSRAPFSNTTDFGMHHSLLENQS